MDKQLLNSKLQPIKMVIMDVDGTLTDGGMYYDNSGSVMKKFNAQDGMGITLLHKSGIKTAFITSDSSSIVEQRANKLQVSLCIQGSRNKLSSVQEVCTKFGITFEQCAFIGDDVNDEIPMTMVGFSACPSDAVRNIKKVSSYVLEAKGGEGAVREFCEILLAAQGKSNTVTENW